jgi:pyrroline-5-carboxylate reductase
MPRLVVIGGGRMGSALIAGLVRAGWSPGEIAIAEKDPLRREAIGEELPGVEVGPGPFAAEAVVLAVKPSDAEVATGSGVQETTRRVLSIMAGVSIRTIESWLSGSTSVLRAMPNSPALVGAGLSALAAGPDVPEEDLLWAESILGAVGKVVRIGEESMDAVTGLSGSGPAYVFLVVEALTQAGIAVGLDEPTSRLLSRQTVVGAGRLLEESTEEPEALRAQVTSPGGTTEAGLAVLGERGLKESFSEAVSAAARRSEELGEAR